MFETFTSICAIYTYYSLVDIDHFTLPLASIRCMLYLVVLQLLTYIFVLQPEQWIRSLLPWNEWRQASLVDVRCIPCINCVLFQRASLVGCVVRPLGQV